MSNEKLLLLPHDGGELKLGSRVDLYKRSGEGVEYFDTGVLKSWIRRERFYVCGELESRYVVNGKLKQPARGKDVRLPIIEDGTGEPKRTFVYYPACPDCERAGNHGELERAKASPVTQTLKCKKCGSLFFDSPQRPVPATLGEWNLRLS